MRFKSMLVGAVLVVMALGLGCSKDKLNDLVDKTKQKVTAGAGKVKQSVSTAADTAKEQLNLAGKAQLKVDSPIETSACYANFIASGGVRPNVLQIRSYSSPEQESFPSMYVRATVTAAGTSELVGQIVPALIFIQKEPDAPVWSCSTGGHIELKIVAVDNKILSAEIVGGTVRGTHQADELPVTGTLSAVWQ